jgi:four helix bundle protein
LTRGIYKGSFLLRLNDAEAEAAESQVWLKFAVKCQYLDIETGRKLYGQYNKVLGLIVIGNFGSETPPF